MTHPSVGVIGTGAMGMDVVRSLTRHGIATFARDIRPEADAEAARLGATVAPTPTPAAANATITILLVAANLAAGAEAMALARRADAPSPDS